MSSVMRSKFASKSVTGCFPLAVGRRVQTVAVGDQVGAGNRVLGHVWLLSAGGVGIDEGLATADKLAAWPHLGDSCRIGLARIARAGLAQLLLHALQPFPAQGTDP